MTTEELRDFLLAVVNAHDRSDRPGLRNRFVHRYRTWFPDDMKGSNAVRVLLLAYSTPHMWWSKDVPTIEKPRTEFALHVAVLRDKLRSIWAAVRSESTARYRLDSLKSDMRDFRRGKNVGNEVWRERTLAALDWLGDDLSRLLTCENPGCRGETRYFFRQWNNQKYCSPYCTERAQELRRLVRRKDKPFKRFKRSEEARLSPDYARF